MNRDESEAGRGNPRRWATACTLLVAVLGCSDSAPTSPPPPPPTGPVQREDVVGSYTATRILVIAAGDTTDVLAEGGSLTLTLEGSAQVRGRLVAPGQGPAGADLDEDMAGAWTFVITSRTVRISQQAATFVRDATFRPARIDDGVGLELTASIAGDAFTGAPAVELRLIRS